MYLRYMSFSVENVMTFSARKDNWTLMLYFILLRFLLIALGRETCTYMYVGR